MEEDYIIYILEVIREFREYVKIENEEVVELDIKSCMISLLYVFIKWLNNNVIEDDLVNDVRERNCRVK